ncbi:helix-turn-helix domain-containing protein [Mesotoga prima]|uniref:helix-turn-helix domain-containing protein n=1 Tax=Mesotoga prima TaxID=1184387 RepID=UPI002FDA1211
MTRINDTKFYDTGEAAELLHCTRWTIREWIKDGTLKASKAGRKYLISEWEIQKLLDWQVKNELSERTESTNEAMEFARKIAIWELLEDGSMAVYDKEGNRIGRLIKE